MTEPELTIKSRNRHQQAVLTVAERDFLLARNPNAIIVTDCNGYIEYVNRVFTNSSGYTEDEVFCRHYNELPLFQSPGVTDEAWEAVTTGKTWEGETLSNRKNGQSFIEHVFLMPILDSEGKVYGVAFINRDISSRKSIEHELLELTENLEQRVLQRTEQLNAANQDLLGTLDELQKTQDQLIESEKLASLGNLVGGIAHEINTPIGIAFTASTHLEKDTRKLVSLYRQGTINRSDLEDYLDTAGETTRLLCSNLDRAGDLIRSFKQVAIDQSGEVKRRFQLRTYLDEVCLSLRPMLKKRPVAIRIHCSHDVELNSYPGAFSQVITNLVSNTISHGFSGNRQGHIDISAEVEEDLLHIRFADDGAGMTADTLEKIFTPFFTTNREQGGSGLGLHIVYNLVTQKLLGSITCKSLPSEGTIFSIKIPFPHH
ncbi:MAG: PAS domain-containing sensor histidine kinase [Thermodesulfobacteriota bacterium]